MFVWQDAQAKLLEPSELMPGQIVLDIGAGPGKKVVMSKGGFTLLLGRDGS